MPTGVYDHKPRGPYKGKRKVSDRFWEKVNKDGPIPKHNPSLGRCWLWIGQKLYPGPDRANRVPKKRWYGKMYADGRDRLAHRLGYELTIGHIPVGLQLDHLCRNPPCVRGTHLEPVTNKENGLRGNSTAAANARKTHCIRGHRLGGDNLRVTTNGGRVCVSCRMSRNKSAPYKKAQALYNASPAKRAASRRYEHKMRLITLIGRKED